MTTRDPVVEPERGRSVRGLRVLIDVGAVGSVVGLGLLVLIRGATPVNTTDPEHVRSAGELAPRSTPPVDALPTESAAGRPTAAKGEPASGPADPTPRRARPRPPARPPFATPRADSAPARARAEDRVAAPRPPKRRAPTAGGEPSSVRPRVEIVEDTEPTTVTEVVEELGRLLRHPCAGPRVRALYSEAHRTLERDEPADVTRDLVKDGRGVLSSARRACGLGARGESGG